MLGVDALDDPDIKFPRVVSGENDTNSVENLSVIQIEKSDGSYTAELFKTPVKFVDNQGEVQFIDTSMESVNLSDTLFGDYLCQNTFTVKYGRTASKGINMNDAFSLSVQDPTAPDSAAVQSTDEDGNGVVKYSGAFGKDTTVEYVNTSGGFEENIVLNSYTGRNTFDFTFSSANYMPVLAKDKSFITIVRKDTP